VVAPPNSLRSLCSLRAGNGAEHGDEARSAHRDREQPHAELQAIGSGTPVAVEA
jgi:hypothetical protein